MHIYHGIALGGSISEGVLSDINKCSHEINFQNYQYKLIKFYLKIYSRFPNTNTVTH